MKANPCGHYVPLFFAMLVWRQGQSRNPSPDLLNFTRMTDGCKFPLLCGNPVGGGSFWGAVPGSLLYSFSTAESLRIHLENICVDSKSQSTPGSFLYRDTLTCRKGPGQGQPRAPGAAPTRLGATGRDSPEGETRTHPGPELGNAASLPADIQRSLHRHTAAWKGRGEWAHSTGAPARPHFQPQLRCRHTRDGACSRTPAGRGVPAAACCRSSGAGAFPAPLTPPLTSSRRERRRKIAPRARDGRRGRIQPGDLERRLRALH